MCYGKIDATYEIVGDWRPTSTMPIAVIVLFLGAFCVGTTEFVIAGLLPEISLDLNISIPTAGYLITAYALGVAIGGPVLTLAIAKFSRKRNLLFLLLIFLAGHLWCANSSSYEMLMAGRLIIALSHGSYFGVAGVVAVSIVPVERRGAAIAWLFAGISVANILGVPGGTAIGNWLGWRATFWIVGAAACFVIAAIYWFVPQDESDAVERPGVGAQITAIANQKVMLAYLTFAVMLIGFWTYFTFVAPHMIEVGRVPKESIAFMLFLFGVGATLGTAIGGRLADRVPEMTLRFGLPAQVLAMSAIYLFSFDPISMAVLLFLAGTIMFIPASSIVNRILQGASSAPDFASTLVSTAANIGIAFGAILGAQILTSGVGYSQLPGVGAAFIAMASFVMLLSIRLERQRQSRD